MTYPRKHLDDNPLLNAALKAAICSASLHLLPRVYLLGSINTVSDFMTIGFTCAAPTMAFEIHL
jgi:hypothetical protein